MSRLDCSFPTLIVGIELFDRLDLSNKLYKCFYFELHFLLINVFVNDFLPIDFELSPPGYINELLLPVLHICELLYALELLTNCPSCFFLKRNVSLYVVYFVLVGQRFEVNIFQFELFRCIFPYRQDFLVWNNSHKGFDLRLLLTIEQRLALSLRGQSIPCPTCSLWLDEAASSVN